MDACRFMIAEFQNFITFDLKTLPL